MGGTIKYITRSPDLECLSLYTVATLWHFRGGVLFEGFIFITPHLPSLVYYGSFFMLGYLFHYHRGILDTFNQHLWWFVGLSVVLFPLAIYFTGLDFATEASGQFHLHAVVSNAFLTWSLIYVFMGLFLRFLDFKSHAGQHPRCRPVAGQVWGYR